MAILQSTQPNLTFTGPLIQVDIGLPSQLRNILEKEKKKIPKPIRTNALIDTGASKSCISSRIANEFKFNPVDIVTMQTAGNPHQTNAYYIFVDLINTFGQPILFDPLKVLEAPLIGQNIGFLVGRDILQRMTFIYTGFTNTILLAI